MFTYQVRPRIFRLQPGRNLTFPGPGFISLHFEPKQPFGSEPSGGRTAVKGVKARAFFNANTGEHSIESEQPLCPLEVTIEEPERTFSLRGNVLRISQSFDSNQQLTELVDSLYFGFPLLLAVDFADPPIVARIDGEVNGVSFRWELAEWRASFHTTTQERQEQAVVDAWNRLGILSSGQRRRLLASLHYFHVSLRLTRRAQVAGEFLAEVILNLSKALEVLFPPDGDGRTRDSAHRGLLKLGFAKEEIEANYIPAMALRNEIDVGHVDLSLFTRDQLSTIHSYVERTEPAFRLLLDKIFKNIAAGTFEVESYVPGPPSSDVVRIIERMKASAVSSRGDR